MALIHHPRYPTRLSAVATDAVILPKRDWKRMKRASFHMTAADELALVRQQEEERRKSLEDIETHRQSILASEERKQLLQRTAATSREIAEREQALEVAEAKANEELDEVKGMNSEMMAARVRTLRDRQLSDRNRRSQEKNEADARDAKMLEDGRLRAVGIYAAREDALRSQRMAGKDVLLAQIEDRKQSHVEDRQRREREIAEMERANELRKAEDESLDVERRTRQKEFLVDCLAANEASRRRKVRERERDIEEVQAMVEYQKEQAAKDAKREAEVQEIKSRKEREIAEIRKSQQKMIDTQAQKDELLARRVQEEKERQARQKELEDVQKRQKTVLELRNDRVKSIEMRQSRLLEMAKVEKAEFDRTLDAQERARERARREYEEQQTRKDQYRKELKDELDARAEERRIRPLKLLDEGKHMQEVNEDYVANLERIREMKLNQLASEGVPDKYLADLKSRRFDIK
jgi:hypothetical protein